MHEIDTTTGTAAVFTTGQTPWHRLGRTVADAETSGQAIQLAGLDWTVVKRKIAAELPAGGWSAIADHFATVRTDTDATLGIVGKHYEPLQNREAFDFMDAVIGDGLARFETAGSLRGGRQIWMLARIPHEIRAADSDVVEPYLLLTNGHDGNSAVRIAPTTVRVVCQNTLALAFRIAAADRKLLTVRHTSSLQARVSVAREQLGLIVDRLGEFQEQVAVLARKTLTSEQLGRYFATLVEGRAEKSQKQMLDQWLANFESERQRLPGIEGSLWAAYNAVSEYADHQMPVLGKGSAAVENRLQSVWFGTASKMKAAAFEAALEMAA